MKIHEHYHDFATILYIRDDGMLAPYYPDFIVKIGEKIFIVETKADRDLKQPDVLSKRLATIDWIEKVNQLNSDDRMSCVWSYVLLGENTFYGMRDKGADLLEILNYATRTKAMLKGTFDDLLGTKTY